MASCVELTGVRKTFGAKVAVDDLNLTVPEGSIYGFIGPNGSGKTTTLRLMLRIYQPDRGRVEVLGHETGRVADDRVGYLPEERGLYKRMKVLELIEFFARLKGFNRCRQAALEWLDRLDASSWANQRLDTLSKGMAQKVQFIVAAIARPKLLILDEPFSGLDPVNMEVLRDVVFDMREQGTTIIFSTHDMSVAERMCDTILMIYEGRKVLDGTLAEIQSKYPIGRIRLRTGDGAPLPAQLPGVNGVATANGYHELDLAADWTPRLVLEQLVRCIDVEHFEVMRPSLHDIFVRIARPREQAEVGG